MIVVGDISITNVVRRIKMENSEKLKKILQHTVINLPFYLDEGQVYDSVEALQKAIEDEFDLTEKPKPNVPMLTKGRPFTVRL